jgi:fumarate reductase subunit C
VIEEFPVATETKTKELMRPMPLDWWVKKPAYTRFMIRDFTSVFIAAYCVFLLVLLYRAVHDDTAAFVSFYRRLQSPVSVVLQLIAFAFAVYHSITFFNLTPKVVVVTRGEERVPDRVIAGAHYVAWIVVSVVMLVIGFMV